MGFSLPDKCSSFLWKCWRTRYSNIKRNGKNRGGEIKERKEKGRQGEREYGKEKDRKRQHFFEKYPRRHILLCFCPKFPLPVWNAVSVNHHFGKWGKRPRQCLQSLPQPLDTKSPVCHVPNSAPTTRSEFPLLVHFLATAAANDAFRGKHQLQYQAA